MHSALQETRFHRGKGIFLHTKKQGKGQACVTYIVLIPLEWPYTRKKGGLNKMVSLETWFLCWDQTLIWCDLGHA